MKRETAIILSISILASISLAYAYSKKKPHIASSILGTLGAAGLIYTLMREKQV